MYPDSYQLKVQADIAINKEVVAKKGFDIVSETNIESSDIGNEIKFNIIVSFRQLYERAFPADERRDFDLLLDIFAKSDGKMFLLRR